ncbi:MAG: metallophosphoesterase [Sedimentisphaerales bacterium]|nr:metallophosphoesterase [Sedimentisphaerales bacterium]
MRIGIISDTHDNRRNVARAIEIFRHHGVQCILHAGDIVAPFTALAFGELRSAKFIAVFGNNDGEKLFLKRTVEGFGGEIHEHCYKGELEGRRICMMHKDHFAEETIRSQMYDLVIYGHTHHPDIRQEGKTLVINPGEATDWITGSGHCVVLDLKDMSHSVEPLG